MRTEEGLYCPRCVEQGRYAPKPESILHAFELVSMSGTVLKITGIGLTRESAEEHLKQFSLKGTDWSNWKLRTPAGAGHAEQEKKSHDAITSEV